MTRPANLVRRDRARRRSRWCRLDAGRQALLVLLHPRNHTRPKNIDIHRPPALVAIAPLCRQPPAAARPTQATAGSR
jgi:hypothetical protein